jgi:hypothetical protein
MCASLLGWELFIRDRFWAFATDLYTP